MFLSALDLCELFEKADADGMGTISIEEYVLMCDTYGVELTEDHLDEFRAIADAEGEVGSSWAAPPGR